MMKPPMTRPLLELLLLTTLLHSMVSAGWSEETDWETGAWAQSQQYPGARGPEFLPGLATNVSVTLGDPALLPCRIANLRGRSVSWIRQTDLQVLTTNSITFTTDPRFSVEGLVRGPAAVWDLRISDAVQSDQGIYQCQVNTRPKMSHPVMLHVVEGSAVIAGPSAVYLHAGSRLLLTCWVHAPPRPPPLHWGHNGSNLNDTTVRGGLSLFISQEGPRASTRLSLQRVDASDAGNYTCYPEGLPAASVTVYVLHEEEPAAMHHDCGHSLAYSSLTAILICSLPLAGIHFFGSSAILWEDAITFPITGETLSDRSLALSVITNTAVTLISATKTFPSVFRSLRNAISVKTYINWILYYSLQRLIRMIRYVRIQFLFLVWTLHFLELSRERMRQIMRKKFEKISVTLLNNNLCLSHPSSNWVIKGQLNVKPFKMLQTTYIDFWNKVLYTQWQFSCKQWLQNFQNCYGAGQAIYTKDVSNRVAVIRITSSYMCNMSGKSFHHKQMPLVKCRFSPKDRLFCCHVKCLLLYEYIKPT